MSELEEIQAQLNEIKELLVSNKKVLNLKEVSNYIGYSSKYTNKKKY